VGNKEVFSAEPILGKVRKQVTDPSVFLAIVRKNGDKKL
jgi:hypothetical protein